MGCLGLQEYYKKMFGMKRLRYRDQPDVSSVCSLYGAARSPRVCVPPAVRMRKMTPEYRDGMLAAGQVHEPFHGQVTTCTRLSAACLRWVHVTVAWHQTVTRSLTASCMPPAGYGPEDQGYFSLELTYNYGKVRALCGEDCCASLYIVKPQHGANQ